MLNPCNCLISNLLPVTLYYNTVMLLNQQLINKFNIMLILVQEFTKRAFKYVRRISMNFGNRYGKLQHF